MTRPDLSALIRDAYNGNDVRDTWAKLLEAQCLLLMEILEELRKR